jgi:diguanylate cyclase (GGDEF)-like protein
MSRLKAWWGQSDQFDWVTMFLRQRGLIRSAQLILATISVSGSWVPLTLLVAQRGRTAASAVVGVLTVAFTVGATYFCLTHWPTRRQSQMAALSAMLATAVWSFVQPNPALAALACAALAVTGGYIALFHGPRLLIVNVLVAAATATYAVLRLADEADFASATAAFWLILFPNFSVPLIIWGMSQAMGTYVQRAEQDPLTGLLNRRAFTEAVPVRLVNRDAAHTHLAVMMLDLDDFKRINDTHGHSAGDRLLQVVAGLLRDHSPADAIVCRAGGEEFLVALTCTVDDVAPLASLFCGAVARHPSGITASIGTASAELHPRCTADGGHLIEELIALADSAMYAAKRRGGNQAYQSTGS